MRSAIILTICAIYFFQNHLHMVASSNEEDIEFTQIGNKYYYIERTKQLNWFGASHFCRSFNSNLASIETAEETKALSEYFKANGLTKTGLLYGGDVFWIGGTDLTSVNNWHWIGTGKPIVYTSWAAGQPDKDKPHDEEERCMSIWPYEVITWNDLRCKDKSHFICERKVLIQYNFVAKEM